MLALPAMATSVYTYTGNDFSDVTGPYTTSDSITGSLTISSPLAANLMFSENNVTPIAYSFTDGVQTFTNNSALTDVIFGFATDSEGNITGWLVSLSDGDDTNRIQTSGYVVLSLVDYAINNSAEGQVVNEPGKWTIAPEPGSLLVVGAGLLAAGVRRRWAGR